MLESSDVVAFAAATDLTRARMFYEQKLGLPVVGQNDFACVFDANGRRGRQPRCTRSRYTEPPV